MGNGSMKSLSNCSSEKSVKSSNSPPIIHSNSGHRKSEELSPFDLSSVQKQVIIDSWHNVDDKITFSEKVFVKIFTRRPSLTTPFRFDTNGELVGVDDLWHIGKFREHILIFNRFLTYIVDNLNNDEIGALKAVHKLGKDHVTKNVSSQYFNRETLNIFSQSLVDCFEEEQKTLGDEYHRTKMTKHIIDTWTTFLTKLFDVLLRSFEENNVYEG